MAVSILRQLPTTSSRWTVLRDVRKAVTAADYTPRVLGVDDWAMRRGPPLWHHSGRFGKPKQLSTLLPDREADTLRCLA